MTEDDVSNAMRLLLVVVVWSAYIGFALTGLVIFTDFVRDTFRSKP